MKQGAALALAVAERRASLIRVGPGIARYDGHSEWYDETFSAFHNKDEEATGPDLTGYGSRKWLISFIANPAHPDFYGERNERMPKFGEDQILNELQIGLVADWLRGAWYEPAGKVEAVKR